MSSEVKYGISLVHFNELADPKLVIEFAIEAEKAGWDGIFLPDHLLYDRKTVPSITDTWILLSAIAAKTKKIKIGTCVSALPRYHPWQFAKLSATLDILSNGRLILGIGLGGPAVEYETFGEKYDIKNLAEKMEESLEIIQGLWTGEPFSYAGKYYQINGACFLPKPVQTPRIPLIIGGMWPNKKPFIRSSKYDGIMPIYKKFPQDLTTEQLKEIINLIKENRKNNNSFEVMTFGTGFFTSDKRTELVKPFIDIGITWWLEHVNTLMQPSVEAMREWVKLGPPKP
jgi:alkanesulfonate monooxygenase SsuD/methylene tetrahydromethanopterin reductase-like flavin-dependent oxidoreductase (luciferase family)